MKHIKPLLRWTPEAYFILFAIWCACENYSASKYTDSVPFNYPAVVLIVLLTLQFFFKNRSIGLIVSSVLGIVSAYLILALWSDFSKNPTFDERGIRFLGIGGLLIIINITMAVLMFRKYLKANGTTPINVHQ